MAAGGRACEAGKERPGEEPDGEARVNVEQRAIADLKAHPSNYQRHPEPQMAVLRESLRTHGLQKPLVIQPDGTILAGHGLWEAAKAEGWVQIACHVYDGPYPEAFLVMDNRSAQMAEPDPQALTDLLKSLQDVGQLEMAGYDPEELGKLLAELEAANPTPVPEEGEIPEPQEGPTRVQPGEVWALGKHRVMCGDSTDAGAVAGLMGTGRAPLLFTSPPYMDAREYGGDADLDVSHVAGFLPVWAAYTAMQAVNLGIVRRENAVVRYWDEYIAAAESAGMKLLSWNVWDRLQPWSMAQNTAMFPIEHEWVFVFGVARRDLHLTVENKEPGTRTGITNRQADGTLERAKPKEVRTHRPLGTVFRHAPHIGRDMGHPAMFPVGLPQEYILACTDSGDTVLDPFLGSGTTLIAAEQTGRIAYGCEIMPKYCDVVLARWENLTGDKAVRVHA